MVKIKRKKSTAVRKLGKVSHRILYANKIRSIFIIATITIIGIIFLIPSKAATPTASIEAEDGIFSPNFNPVTDLNASNGAYLRFGSPKYTIVNNPVYSAYGVSYYYNQAKQNINGGANGVSVNISQANPSTPTGDHSLIELAGSLDNNYNLIEVGWIVDQSQYGDSNTHLFISRWIGNSNQCYAPSTGCGFVQVSSTNNPGKTISPSGMGNFKINYQSNNWYVYYNGDAVGYFPESLWGTGNNKIQHVDIYGEVQIQSNSTTCVPMGNGIAGTSAGSAQVSDYSLLGSSAVASFSSFQQTSNSGYLIGSPAPTSFKLGGPGVC